MVWWMMVGEVFAGCGNGIVERGEVCDDGGRSCAVGVEFCNRCVSCARRVMSSTFGNAHLTNPRNPWCTHARRDGETLSSTYNANGQLLTFRSSSLQTVATYNPDGTLATREEHSEGKRTSRRVDAYENGGKRESHTQTDGIHFRTVETRTPTDRVSESFQDGVSMGRMQWTYDEMGRMTRRTSTTPDGELRDQKIWTFDDHNMVTQVEHTLSGEAPTLLRYDHAYDKKGGLRRTVATGYGNDTTTIEYAYKRWPDRVVTSTSDSSTRVERFEGGLRVQVNTRNHVRGPSGAIETFQYDPAGRTVSQEQYWFEGDKPKPKAPPSVVETFTYECLPASFPSVP